MGRDVGKDKPVEAGLPYDAFLSLRIPSKLILLLLLAFAWHPFNFET